MLRVNFPSYLQTPGQGLGAWQEDNVSSYSMDVGIIADPRKILLCPCVMFDCFLCVWLDWPSITSFFVLLHLMYSNRYWASVAAIIGITVWVVSMRSRESKKKSSLPHSSTCSSPSFASLMCHQTCRYVLANTNVAHQRLSPISIKHPASSFIQYSCNVLKCVLVISLISMCRWAIPHLFLSFGGTDCNSNWKVVQIPIQFLSCSHGCERGKYKVLKITIILYKRVA